jgi:hypothetical protein
MKSSDYANQARSTSKRLKAAGVDATLDPAHVKIWAGDY